jgi:hypothetical protein
VCVAPESFDAFLKLRDTSKQKWDNQVKNTPEEWQAGSVVTVPPRILAL